MSRQAPTTTRPDPAFLAVRAREVALWQDLTPDEIEALGKMLSANAKTSVSLDFPIGHTCRPTRLCSRVCYAHRGGHGRPAPAAWGGWCSAPSKTWKCLRFMGAWWPSCWWGWRSRGSLP